MSEESEGVCQECGRDKAKIHITDFIDGKPVKKHICQKCYDAEGGMPSLSSSDLFAKLVGIIAPEVKKAGRQKCSDCGIDYIEFRQSFKFGCAKDYVLFKDALDELFEDIHGASHHTGRVPEGKAQSATGTKQRVEMLNRELAKAVEKEDFERAAQLKRKIKQVEQSSVGSIKK